MIGLELYRSGLTQMEAREMPEDTMDILERADDRLEKAGTCA